MTWVDNKAAKHEPEGMRAAWDRFKYCWTEVSHATVNMGAESARWAGLPPKLGKAVVLVGLVFALVSPAVTALLGIWYAAALVAGRWFNTWYKR